MRIALILFSLLQLSGCISLSSLIPKKATPQKTIENTQDQTSANTTVLNTTVLIVEQHNEEQYNPDITKHDIPNKDKSHNIEKNSASVSPDIKAVEIQDKTIENIPADDLWQQLKGSFSLEYSNPSDPTLQHFEKWYAKHPKYFDRLAKRAYWFMPYVYQEIQKRNMPAEVALLPAIESAYRPEAVSRSNAVGMWQFISTTGKRFGLRQDWWVEGRSDMVQSTRAALDYLEFLADEFDHDWELVFAAYNAGEGKIRREIRNNKKANKPSSFTDLNLRKETREYVPKLFAVRNIIKRPEAYGIRLTPIPNAQTLAVVDVRNQTDLAVAASLIDTTAEKLRFFNRGYKRGVTPPNGPHTIVLPINEAEILLTRIEKLSHQERLRWARHQVRKGEYLGRIARKHGVTVDSIMQANELSSNLIKPGQELKIPISIGQYQYAKSSSKEFKTQNSDTLYTVRPGDSLWKISQQAGVVLSKILRWNGISKNTLLYPGQQLIISRP